MDLSPRLTLALWLLSGVLLLLALGNPPVTRSQEARVLETSRQMLGTGAHGWLLPILNGEPRLKKPPLAYWTTAAAYLVGGVSETIGRIPTAIAGWLTLGITFAFASRLFDQRIALASCAALLGSHMFFRHMRLAETDALATLFITLAIYALWRSSQTHPLRWMHLAAASAAMVVLAKGAPAIFIAVSFVAFCWIERRWDLLRQFLRNGAWLTFLAIAVPWFAYVHLHETSGTFLAEIKNTATGGDHFGWPWDYIPSLLLAAAPWVGFLPLAIYDAARRWRSDQALRITLLWALSILIPLCINGNKQNHYLLMLTPPTMILVGRLLIAWPEELTHWMKAIFIGTMIVATCAVCGPPIYGRLARGHILPGDWIAAAALAAAVAIIVWISRRRTWQAGIVASLALMPLIMVLIVGVWLPNVPSHTVRTAAAQIRQRFGDGPYVFFGSHTELPLCFYLRRPIPDARTAQELQDLAAPGVIAIAEAKRGAPPPAVPPPFLHALQVNADKDTFHLYALDALR